MPYVFHIKTMFSSSLPGADPGVPPLKLEKIRFFGIKSWFFTRNTPKMFVSPSARHNFFKCPSSLTWNSGSTPEYDYWFLKQNIQYNLCIHDICIHWYMVNYIRIMVKLQNVCQIMNYHGICEMMQFHPF